MKLTVILMFVMLFVVGCSTMNDSSISYENDASEISQLMLTEQELSELAILSDNDACKIESYETSEYSSLEQYAVCKYIMASLNNTEIILELKKYTNLNDLNGSYDYESSHLFGAKGIISENTYGDRSKFHVSSNDDYGAEFNTPDIYFYHLWICKDTYLIHITTNGSINAKEIITIMGEKILSKFD